MTPATTSSGPLRVLVAGAAGYVGGELLRLLLAHPEVGACTALSRSHAGQPLASVHPGLALLTDAHFVDGDVAELRRSHDVLLLALPHGESSRILTALGEDWPLLLDLAADFRIADPALYAAYYGPHPVPELLPRFVYGLADVAGTALRGTRAIAVPGCFATAAQLALYPLRELLVPGVTPSLFAVTGSSGAGSHVRDTTHHPMRAHNLFAYSVLSHRHDAEILASWRGWTGRADASARLLAHSGPLVRGIYLTLHATLPQPIPAGTVARAFAAAYADRPLVRLVKEPPQLTHVVGSSLALAHAAQSTDGTEVQVMIAIDNLLKGAAGQAVQAMNLALGLPETTGLRGGGAFPC